MVTAKTVKGLADRLAKAEALVDSGAVFPVAGCSGYAVVRNGTGDQMYLVRTEAGRENCTCPDFKQRQAKDNLPCKHILAAELALGTQPTPPAAPTMSPTKVDPALGLSVIMAPRQQAA